MSKNPYIVAYKLCSLSKFQRAHCLQRIAASGKTLSAHERGSTKYGITCSKKFENRRLQLDQRNHR